MLSNPASLLGCSCIPGCFSFLFLEVFTCFQLFSIFSYSSLNIFVTPGQTSTQHRSCWRGNERKGRRGNVFFLAERVETKETLSFLSNKNCKYVVNMHKTPYSFAFVSVEVKVTQYIWVKILKNTSTVVPGESKIGWVSNRRISSTELKVVTCIDTGSEKVQKWNLSDANPVTDELKVQGFFPLRVEITQFPNGFHLKVSIPHATKSSSPSTFSYPSCDISVISHRNRSSNTQSDVLNWSFCLSKIGLKIYFVTVSSQMICNVKMPLESTVTDTVRSCFWINRKQN